MYHWNSKSRWEQTKALACTQTFVTSVSPLLEVDPLPRIVSFFVRLCKFLSMIACDYDYVMMWSSVTGRALEFLNVICCQGWTLRRGWFKVAIMFTRFEWSLRIAWWSMVEPRQLRICRFAHELTSSCENLGDEHRSFCFRHLAEMMECLLTETSGPKDISHTCCVCELVWVVK